MSLTTFKRKPWKTMFDKDFFEPNEFFDMRLPSIPFIESRFWNGKWKEPALNIIETDDEFKVELAAPGFSKKDFEVTIADGCLNISAEKKVTKEEEKMNYKRKEFSYNAFERSLMLPETVKEEEIKAKYKDGILSFDLYKKEEARKEKPKLIEIA
ncbi:MAG: Hsp20/alpha crystallin family protein [Bacteroidia bacterium]|nr:Hsp20/alpha crystallin family protein [Bacteroidia bacterium]MBT8292882.1 Hsp20/alpha crystallin family protein [Eudoraea sp.]NNF30108.1 Hsp20/alpha crystallin family protein [Flavobacteriaceae bacterium]MBT8274986.1 Hsp20/alpha crystallin family protein [Bacteroidia bacterium]NNJ80594.1 Hsp20/alpha crystallin family protein [Flavobacteriaceae bacterium]